MKVKVFYNQQSKRKSKTIEPPDESISKYRNDLIGYFRGYLLGVKPIDWKFIDKKGD